MGIELELGALLLSQLIGTSIFGIFEMETPAWKKILKWLLIDVITLALFFEFNHWALLFPFVIIIIGTSVHFFLSITHGIHPFNATPRKKYYEFRGWKWVE
jgi:hypothetical protein